MSRDQVLEDFKQYLPQYLTAYGKTKLFEELRDFPTNIDKRFYTSRWQSEKVLFQGDCLEAMPVIRLPDPKIGDATVMVLSNTCDINPTNKRLLPPRITYCPVVSLARYEELVSNISRELPVDHIANIRAQKVSSVFFLPRGGALSEDAVALFDHANNCALQHVQSDDLPKKRLCTLSDFGFYVLLYKMSVHFTRIREGLQRSEEPENAILEYPATKRD